MRKQEYDDAILKFRKAISLDMDVAEAYSRWGVALLLSGEVRASIQKFNRALELEPRYIDRYRALHRVFLYMGHYDEAETIARKVREFTDAGTVDTEAGERAHRPVQVKHVSVPCENRNLRLYGW